MITYERISRKPQLANGLIGMSLSEFDVLYAKFETAYTARESALQSARPPELAPRRAAGAGRKHKYSLRDRLVMTLFWLISYTTYDALGFIYDINKSNVEDNLKSVLDVLATVPGFHFDLPPSDLPKMRTFQEVMITFPGICQIISAKEQNF